MLNRKKVVQYLNYRKNRSLNFGRVDVEFVQRYIEHKKGKIVPLGEISSAMESRSNTGELIKFVDNMINHLLLEFSDIKVNTISDWAMGIKINVGGLGGEQITSYE